jgi:hypothetical protein
MDPASCKLKATSFENWREAESEAALHPTILEFPTVDTTRRPDVFTCKEDLVNQSCWLAGLLIGINGKLRTAITATWCTLGQCLSKTCKHFSQSISLLTIINFIENKLGLYIHIICVCLLYQIAACGTA